MFLVKLLSFTSTIKNSLRDFNPGIMPAMQPSVAATDVVLSPPKVPASCDDLASLNSSSQATLDFLVSHPSMQRLRLLLVDDWAPDLEYTRLKLARLEKCAQASVTTTTDSANVVDIYRKAIRDGVPYDAILLDWAMESHDAFGQCLRGRNGDGVLRDLACAAQKESLTLPPVVFVSGDDAQGIQAVIWSEVARIERAFGVLASQSAGEKQLTGVPITLVPKSDTECNLIAAIFHMRKLHSEADLHALAKHIAQIKISPSKGTFTDEQVGKLARIFAMACEHSIQLQAILTTFPEFSVFPPAHAVRINFLHNFYTFHNLRDDPALRHSAKNYLGCLDSEVRQTLRKLSSRIAEHGSNNEDETRLAFLQRCRDRFAYFLTLFYAHQALPQSREIFRCDQLLHFIEDRASQAERNALCLTISEEAHAAHIRCNAHLFRQLLLQPIQNGISFSPVGKVVDVVCTLQSVSSLPDHVAAFFRKNGSVIEEVVQICVADKGPGIPAENLSRIFEHSFTTRSSTGWGLGFLSETLPVFGATKHVESKTDGPDRGTRFYLYFPCIVGEAE